MTADEQAQVAAYVRTLADQIGLRDWQFKVSDKPASDDRAAAEIECTYGRKWATISLAHDWTDQSPEEHRQTITHELLHCHLQQVANILHNLETNLGDHVYGVVKCSLNDAIEYATDAIADALAPYLPLPNEEAADTSEEAA